MNKFVAAVFKKRSHSSFGTAYRRIMLVPAGVHAFPVSCYSGGERYVEQW